jgi:hypothetical protein
VATNPECKIVGIMIYRGKMYAVTINGDRLPEGTKIVSEVISADQAMAILRKCEDK